MKTRPSESSTPRVDVSREGAASFDSAFPEGVLPTSAEELGERPVLRRLLEAWTRAEGGGDSALYLASEQGFTRELTVGTTSFPTTLEQLPSGETPWLNLAGGFVLHSGQQRRVLNSPLEMLLAASVRIHQQQRQLKRQHFQVNYRILELEALYDVGLAIASTLNLEELSEEILLRAVSLLDARRGALYLVDDGAYRLNRTIGGDARPTVGVEDPQVERLLSAEAENAQELLPGASHLLAVPIAIENRPRGLLVVADKESRHGVGPFLASDRRTLSLFANQAAIALENARLHRQALEKERLEREMELAAEIQRGILPKGVPEITGYELIGWNRPTRQVGGDYYHFLPLANGRLGVAVGDVTGKGMPAALLVSTLHSALHLLLDQVEVGAVLLERLNQHVAESSAANKFITLLLAELDPAAGRLQYLNAGHNPGLLVRSSGTVHKLESAGFPLGLLPGSQYRSEYVDIAPGDLLCLYSDGITESESPKDEEFGLERLESLLLKVRDRPLPEVVQAVDRATRDFAGGRPQSDDQTLLLLRRD